MEEAYLQIAGIVRDSIVDGPGIRFTVFCQGCPHHCPGCHNPQSHDPDGGMEGDTQELLSRLAGNPLLNGLTLSGGEPFAQCEAMLELARGAHALGKDVWAYSGWTLEELLPRPEARALLEECDVLVDGPFLLGQRSLTLLFRGSKNQRVLDVPASLAAGRPVEWRDPWEF